MAVLNDAGAKIRNLLDAIDRAQRSYEVARNAYQAASEPATAPPDLSGIGLVLTIGDHQLPVPLPADLKNLAEHLATSINHQAAQIAQLWRELHTTSLMAVQYVDQAFAQSQEPEAEPVPPAIAPFPQATVPPQPQAPQLPPSTPPQRTGLPAAVTLPTGKPVTTVPVQ